MKIARLTPLLLLPLLIACYTTYYTRTFRLDTIDPGTKGFRPPDEVFTGPLGKVGPWDMGIRIISTFESNEKVVLRRDTFAVTVTAHASERPGLWPAVANVHLTLPETGKTITLDLKHFFADSVTYKPDIYYTYRFGDVRIPAGIDTIQVHFEVRSPQPSVVAGKQFDLTMVRFEGKFAKFGVRPKGW